MPFIRLAKYILPALTGLMFCAQAVDYLNFAVDDVFISLRVAENVVRGNGYVYNVGEMVEGYSNWLFVTLLALVGNFLPTAPNTFAGASTPAGGNLVGILWVAKGYSLLFGLGSVLLTFIIARRLSEQCGFTLSASKLIGHFAAFGLVCCGPFLLWSMGGLESTQAAYLLLLCVILVLNLLEKRRERLSGWLLGIVCGVTALVRPEMVMYSVITIGFVLIAIDRRRHAIPLLLPFTIILLSLLVWRWSTYHDLVPNTYYAKTSGGLKSYLYSIKYLLGGLITVTGVLILVAPFAYFLKEIWRPLSYISLLVVGDLLFIAYSGGDWMAGYRFFIPIAPLLVILGCFGALYLYTAANESGKYLGKQRFSWVLVSYLLMLGLAQVYSSRALIRGQVQTMNSGFSGISGHSVGWHEKIGAWFREHEHRKVLVATGEAGMIGYMNPNLSILDLGGLLDKHIAHAIKRGDTIDTRYVLQRDPDYVLSYNSGAAAETLRDTHPIISARAASAYPEAVVGDLSFNGKYHLIHHFVSLDLYGRNGRTPPKDTVYP